MQRAYKTKLRTNNRQAELKNGKTPDEIRRIVSMSVGPERQGLALRCAQAARHLTRVEK